MGELILADTVPAFETIPAAISDIVSVPAYCGSDCLCVRLGAVLACRPPFDMPFEVLSPEDAQSLHTAHGRRGDPLAWLLLAEQEPRPPALAGVAGVLCVPMTIILRSVLPHYLVAATLDAARAILPAGLGRLTLSIFAAASGAPEVWF